MARLAAATGVEFLGLLNHASNPARPHHADRSVNEKILHHLNEVLLLNDRRTPGQATVLAGVEASLLPEGGLDVDDNVLSHLDVVIASRHGGPPVLPQRVVAQFLTVMENPHVDILGHPSRYLDRLSLADWETILHQATATRTAIEFNLRLPFSRSSAAIAAAAGTYVALGSDTHRETGAEGRLVAPGAPEAEALLRALLAAGVKRSRILNTWPLPRLQAWLTRRADA